MPEKLDFDDAPPSFHPKTVAPALHAYCFLIPSTPIPSIKPAHRRLPTFTTGILQIQISFTQPGLL